MRIAVVGPGLIGRSVTLAARRADHAAHIVEIDAGGSLDAARGAEIIVLATPVDIILDLIRNQADAIRTGVVLDTGSTKRAIVTAARTSGLDNFVGGHPMAGAASSGPAAAHADLFVGRPWFLVPSGASETALRTTQSFVESLGARPIVMTDDGTEHDRIMAAVSHVPQVVASALMAVVGDAAGDALHWAGNGLRDTTRLAQSRAMIWQSILATNAVEVSSLLHALARELDHLAGRLDDERAVAALFERANQHRQALERAASVPKPTDAV